MGRKPKIDPAFVNRIWQGHPGASSPRRSQERWQSRRYFEYFEMDLDYPRSTLYRSKVLAYCDHDGRLFWKTKLALPNSRAAETSYTPIKAFRRRVIVDLIQETGKMLTEKLVSDTDAEILLDLLNLELAKRL